VSPEFKRIVKFGFLLAAPILIVTIVITLAVKGSSLPAVESPPAARMPPSATMEVPSPTMEAPPQKHDEGSAAPAELGHPGGNNSGGDKHDGVKHGGAGNNSGVPDGAGNNGGVPDTPDFIRPREAGLGSPATERQEFLDRQLSFLRTGQLVYRPPSPMRVSDWRRVVVRVSGTSAPPDFVAGLPGSGPVRDRRVWVGSDLIADLTGPDFNIVRVGSDDGRRTLETGTFAEWQWDVQPLHSGPRNLTLVLYVRLQDGGPPVDVKTFVENVEVEINPVYIALQWAKDYGPATGLTVPVIVAAVWAVVRRGRQSMALATAGVKPAGNAPNRKRRPLKKRNTRSRPRRSR